MADDSPGSAKTQGKLSRYSTLAYWFDQAFRVPGTSWRFGLDALIGLFPGVGDAVTAFVGAYGVIIARQLGAPASVQARMLLNLFIDTTIGAIPFLGDLFDFAFKSHVRNLALLESWLASPRKTQRSSSLLLAVMLLALVALLVGAVWIAFITVRALIHLIGQ